MNGLGLLTPKILYKFIARFASTNGNKKPGTSHKYMEDDNGETQRETFWNIVTALSSYGECSGQIDLFEVEGDVLYFHSSDLPDILLIGTCSHL